MAQYRKIAHKRHMMRRAMLAVLALGLAASFFLPFSVKLLVLFTLLSLASTLYLWMFVRAVENACMYKRIPASKLTEGDWVAEKVMHQGKVIYAPSKLGISKEDIALLQKKKSIVRIKEGIPFVPSFFLGWMAAVLLGNLLQLAL